LPLSHVNIQKDIETISKIEVIPAILDIIRQSTGMGFAVVARVTDKKWVALAVDDAIEFGLKVGGELVLDTTICNEIRENTTVVAIDYVPEDKRYCDHHTPKTYKFESYISMPIVLKDGSFFGTLCAIDPGPAKVNNSHVIEMFRMYADLISFHIDAVRQLELAEVKLQEERENAELRDQFIAILGHDLRNPVGAISNAAELLLRIPGNERSNKLAHIIQDSTFRVKILIDNMLDFAMGRMGNGIELNVSNDVLLAETLTQVISELQMIHPDRDINVMMDIDRPVPCDSRRVAQLFSNLLANALTHGDPASPVSVTAVTEPTNFSLCVSNAGTKIPEEKLNGLFKPFYRGDSKHTAKGLGLGLYIAKEIALAHGGDLTVTSTDEQTCFKLSLDI